MKQHKIKKLSPEVELFGMSCDFIMIIKDWRSVFYKIEKIKPNDIKTIGQIYPQINRTAYLVVLMIIFESEIKNISDFFKKNEEEEIKLSDFKGSMMERFLLFMNKVIKIKMNNYEEIEFINSIISLRNCIVHANGNINEIHSNDKQAIEKLRQKIKGITIKEGWVNISRAFCLNCSKKVQYFITGVYDLIRKKYKNTINI